MSMLEKALQFAGMGWPVFPCNVEKRPVVEGGFLAASVDPSRVEEWWNKYPNASIGSPTGPIMGAEGAFVLDVDLPEGPGSLAGLEALYGRLPETVEQRTGSGGRQLFFKWPSDGRDIRNSAGKIGADLDVRGDGGYVILPPSGHPSGGHYQWMTSGVGLADAPEWLLKLVCKKPEQEIIREYRTPDMASYGSTSAYGRAALEAEVSKVIYAGEGTRNHTLNAAAFCVAQLVAGGELDRREAEDALLDAARCCGLNEREAMKTVASGFKSGEGKPRTAPEQEHWSVKFSDPELVDKVDKVDRVDKGDKVDRVDTCRQLVDTLSTEGDILSTKSTVTEFNLAQEMKDWVVNSEGWFTATQVDTEFALRAREEKKYRSKILNRLVEEGVLKKDRTTKGKFCHIKTDLAFIDLDATAEDCFPLTLPLGLGELLDLPAGIAVLAGSSNAGKTSFLLELLRLNLGQPYPLLYLMSEMGPNEYKSRLRRFGDDLSPWKGVMAAAKATGFDGVIKAHNPKGLSVVDYLEEVDGEYFKISSAIRDIYDSLDGGLAFVALQKKSGSSFGRGGEATQEKARLYLCLDNLCNDKAFCVCSLKIIKAKCYKDENPNGKEIHFTVTRGGPPVAISSWMRLEENERNILVEKYKGIAKHGLDFSFECPF